MPTEAKAVNQTHDMFVWSEYSVHAWLAAWISGHKHVWWVLLQQDGVDGFCSHVRRHVADAHKGDQDRQGQDKNGPGEAGRRQKGKNRTCGSEPGL